MQVGSFNLIILESRLTPQTPKKLRLAVDAVVMFSLVGGLGPSILTAYARANSNLEQFEISGSIKTRTDSYQPAIIQFLIEFPDQRVTDTKRSDNKFCYQKKNAVELSGLFRNVICLTFLGYSLIRIRKQSQIRSCMLHVSLVRVQFQLNRFDGWFGHKCWP